MLPLQTVRGNFARIHSALNELLNLSERGSAADSDVRQLDLAAVELAVHDAVAMFQRQAQGLLQVHRTVYELCLILCATAVSQGENRFDQTYSRLELDWVSQENLLANTALNQQCQSTDENLNHQRSN